MFTSDFGGKKNDPVFHILVTQLRQKRGRSGTTLIQPLCNLTKSKNDPVQLLPSCWPVDTVNIAPSGFSEFGNNRKKLFFFFFSPLEGADRKSVGIRKLLREAPCLPQSGL